MIYKSYILEQNIQQIEKNKLFLFYGENDGLKKEFKEKIQILNGRYGVYLKCGKTNVSTAI